MLKRTSDESNNNKDEGSDSDLRQDNAKRAKLVLSSDKTFHDLPVRILERLLVKAVVMEVKDMKLVKSVWKDKADLAIHRLRAVCSQWDRIFKNNFCRSEIHNILDCTTEVTYRVDLLQLSSTPAEAIVATALRDEIFMVCEQPDQTFSIVVYDRHNTADSTDIIALPGMSLTNIACCGVSNCVYVGILSSETHCHSVSRITKVAEHQFQVSPLICNLLQPVSYLSVSSSGNLVILSRDIIATDISSGQLKINHCLVKIYDPTGSLLHEITLIPDIVSIRYVFNAIQKSNGNILLASVCASLLLLTEIDVNGRLLRQYQSALLGSFGASVIEIRGRILICDHTSRMELLDSELNRLDLKDQNQHEDQYDHAAGFDYNCERNEIVRTCDLESNDTTVLTIFRFKEI